MSDTPHIVRKRLANGITWYVYAWRGGPQVHRSEGPQRPKITTAILKAIVSAQEQRAAPAEGTLRSLIRMWRSEHPDRPSSPEWERLTPTTKATWGFAINAIEEKWGDVPLTLFNDPRMKAKVVQWRDSRSATPRAADIGVTVLSRLLEFGRLRALVLMNVAAGVPALYQGADRSEIVWSGDDMDAFALSAIALNRPHVIDGLWLGALTGMRREDLIGLTFAEVGEHAIVRLARKRSRGRRRRATIPLLPETVALLAELREERARAPGVNTVLVNSRGRPWKPASFTQAFNQVRDAANKGRGIVHPGEGTPGEKERPKHLHDLRGTFVTRLCRAGLSDSEIADVAAWSPQNVASVRRMYVDDASVVVALSRRIGRAL